MACAFVLWTKGYEENVALQLLILIGKAEIAFEDGENAAKLNAVLTGIYEKFPHILKLLYTKEDMIAMINKIVKDTKDWLQNKAN